MKEGDKMNIKPLGKRVLVRPVPVEEQETAGGIIIPATTKEVSVFKGEVVEIGDDVTRVKVGDLILVTQHVGDRANQGSEEFYILDEEALLATIDR